MKHVLIIYVLWPQYMYMYMYVFSLTENFPTMVSVLRQLDYEASFAFPNFQGPRLDLGGQKPERTNTKVWSSIPIFLFYKSKIFILAAMT